MILSRNGAQLQCSYREYNKRNCVPKQKLRESLLRLDTLYLLLCLLLGFEVCLLPASSYFWMKSLFICSRQSVHCDICLWHSNHCTLLGKSLGLCYASASTWSLSSRELQSLSDKAQAQTQGIGMLTVSASRDWSQSLDEFLDTVSIVKEM